MNINKEDKDLMLKLGWKIINPEYLPSVRDRNSVDILIYYLNGFIAYQRSYYIVLSGKFPQECALNIWNEYDNKEYLIRVNGGSETTKPTAEVCSHPEINRYLDSFDFRLDSFIQFDKNLIELRNQLIKENSKDFYVKEYHIDTLKGLKIISDCITSNKIQNNMFL